MRGIGVQIVKCILMDGSPVSLLHVYNTCMYTYTHRSLTGVTFSNGIRENCLPTRRRNANTNRSCRRYVRESRVTTETFVRVSLRFYFSHFSFFPGYGFSCVSASSGPSEMDVSCKQHMSLVWRIANRTSRQHVNQVGAYRPRVFVSFLILCTVSQHGRYYRHYCNGIYRIITIVAPLAHH